LIPQAALALERRSIREDVDGARQINCRFPYRQILESLVSHRQDPSLPAAFQI
jgi:hypothetical protein